jgi:hypothetical protein
MRLKIECHRNHESIRIDAKFKSGERSPRRPGDAVLASANEPAIREAETVSSCAPMCATGAAALLGEEFPHFCAGSVCKKVLLKAAPVAEEEIRSPLINDVSREQVQRGVDVADTFAVDQPVLALSAVSFGLVEKSPEVLAGCLAIPRLMTAADDDI